MTSPGQVKRAAVLPLLKAELSNLSLQDSGHSKDLARACGKKKQSIDRWVDEFKRAFPGIRTKSWPSECARILASSIPSGTSCNWAGSSASAKWLIALPSQTALGSAGRSDSV